MWSPRGAGACEFATNDGIRRRHSMRRRRARTVAGSPRSTTAVLEVEDMERRPGSSAWPGCDWKGPAGSNRSVCAHHTWTGGRHVFAGRYCRDRWCRTLPWGMIVCYPVGVAAIVEANRPRSVDRERLGPRSPPELETVRFGSCRGGRTPEPQLCGTGWRGPVNSTQRPCGRDGVNRQCPRTRRPPTR